MINSVSARFHLKKLLKRGLTLALSLGMLFSSTAIMAAGEDADTAQPVSLADAITLNYYSGDSTAANLTDGNVSSYLTAKGGWSITVSAGESIQGAYLQWHTLPDSYSISWLSQDGNEIRTDSMDPDFVNDYEAAPDGACGFTLSDINGAELSEITAYGPGNLPEDLQQWAATEASNPLMLICGYPGDELLYFGSLVPYCVNQGIPLTIVYMSSYDRTRQEEGLDALWALGIRNYPIYLERETKHSKDVNYLIKNWKQGPSEDRIKTLITNYQPQVIISFDEDGITEHLYQYKDSYGKQRNFGEAQTAATGQIVLSAVQKAAKMKGGYAVTAFYAVSESDDAFLYDINLPLGYYSDRTGQDVVAETYQTYYASLRTYNYTPAADLKLVCSYGEAEVPASGDILAGISYEPLHDPVPTATLVPTPTPEPTAEPTAEPEASPDVSAEESAKEDSAAVSGAAVSSLPLILALCALIPAAALIVCGVLTLRGKLPKTPFVIIAAVCLALTVLLAAAAIVLRRSQISAAAAAPTAEPTLAPTAVPTAEPTPTPTPAPEELSVTEAPAEETASVTAETDSGAADTATAETSKYEEYFLHSDTETESITVDVDNGYWSYQSKDFAVFIHRYQATGGSYSEEETPLVWFVADIYMREGVDSYRAPFSDEGRTGRSTVFPWKFARSYKSVLFINGDNMLNMDVKLKGTIIRDGHVYSTANKAADVLAWNHETQTFDYFKKSEYTCAQLVEAGYANTYSFGPIILLNGEIQTESCEGSNVSQLNPRCGVGTAEDGHTVAIVVDGRRPQYSVGVDLLTYAQMFKDYGCTTAYNLDGGVSSCMIFMGEQLNSHGNKKDYSQQRHMPDGLTFGYSEQVPTVDDPIYNDGTDREATEADYH